ncbi:hypothetical protein KSF_006040 [Reticulibacter mediterranei]|uniref:DUF6603 domain-containing protein n=1 Tax=Reticulibacter mediterranei TaxID=2778369 RepID=A0A8J3IHX4_9CHLR|nr:DUF6603 domain-containing protein [Reticulibacter mediterranei]GHO90556.1 hypothetical protein KSF_006040 [Reticulibacter mediterranei]
MANVLISNDTLTMDDTTYQSTAFSQVLQIFGISQLPINAAQVTPDGDGSKNFTITGNVNLFSTAIDGVTLYLDFITTDTFQFQLQGLFPSFQLSTIRAQQILPANELTNLSELLGMTFQNVTFVFDSERGEIYFGLLQSSSQLTSLSANGLALNKIGFEFLRVYADNRITFSMYAEIAIGSTLIDTKIQIPLGGVLSANNWTLTIDSVLLLSSGLQDLIAFLEGTNIGSAIGVPSFADIFPDQLHQIPVFSLSAIEIQFNPLAGKISSLAFQLGSVYPFEVGNLFTLDKVGLRMFINVANPGFSLTVFGAIKVKDDASISLAVRIPENKQDNWILTMEVVLYLQSIADIAGLPINTPFGELSLPDALLTINDLRLNLFEVDFNPINQTVSAILIDVAFYAECDIYGLKIANPQISLNLMNPFNQAALPPREINGSIAGVIGVGGINFDLNAEKSGSTWLFVCKTEPGAIDIGAFIIALSQQFDLHLPDALRGITLQNISLTFSTTSSGTDPASKTSNLLFTCEGKFVVEGQDVDIVVTIEVRKDGAAYDRTIGGHVMVGSRKFTLRFDQSNTSTSLIATYDKQGGEKIKVKEDLIAPLSTDIAQYIPDGLEIDFKDVLFVYRKSNTGQNGAAVTTFLFGVDLSVDFPSLSNLPLVGQALPTDQTITVNNVQILVASNSVQQSDVMGLNSQIPTSVTKLPGTDLRAGLNFSASIMFGGTPQILAAPIVNQNTPATPPPAVASPPVAGVTAADNVKWFTLQKAFGPVNFNRVGVKYEDAVVQFLLDASLSLAGLTLSLDGLSFGSPLKIFAPQFDLRGLGIDYRSGAAEIGGAFLHSKGMLNGKAYDEYDGAAVIKTTSLTLSALGSYAVLDNPSLFIYAILDYPLGGPAFFFVTGLAAGFGYNRALLVPPVDQIAQFPLVTAAVNGASPPQNTKDLTEVLAKLALYIHPELGQNFFAIGIKFTSFKIIDSFVLLAVAFGNQLEINVLGLSTMIQPPPVPGTPPVTPVAVVQMAVKASFVPARGFLGVSAQLTSASYLIDRACQLTGGFAFYTWFAGEHAGEFVQTLGGYHPNFVAPDYYPRVPRLGYNWQVNSELSIKGEAYFALTAAAMMAGLRVQANWNSGNLRAWFNLSADFILAWKPFHYDATAHVNLGASYTFQFFGTHHLTFDVGADLHIWGPEFSGQAHINLDIISFDISFGRSAAQQLSPIEWPIFKQSFLPADNAICSIAVTDGLVGKQGQDAQDLGVINPKNFVLVTNAVVPSSGAQINTSALTVSHVAYLDDATGVRLIPFSAASPQGDLVQVASQGVKTKAIGAPAIGPVGVQTSEFACMHTITITRNGLHVERDFAYTPVLKNVPTALWGQYVRQGQYLLPPDLNGQRFIVDALSGFEIRPAVQATPGETAPVDPGKLQYDPENIQAAYEWEQDPVAFQAETLDEAGRRQRISSSIVDAATLAARQQLCQALGVNLETIDLDATIAGEVASDFLFAPQIEKAG